MKLLLSILLLASSASADSYEQKAKQIQQELDEVISEGQKHIDYFDAVVLPRLDEYEKQRKQRGKNERVHPRRSFRGDDVGFNNRGYLLLHSTLQNR